MSHRSTGVSTVLATAGALVFLGCSQPPTGPLTDEERDSILGRAVLSVGFPCESVVHAEQIDERGTTLRVACANADVYLATVEDGGDICFEPVLYLDPAPGGASTMVVVSPDGTMTERRVAPQNVPQTAPGNRCTSGIDLS